jgi:cadmium resistance protein CadD (predicted permease)
MVLLSHMHNFLPLIAADILSFVTTNVDDFFLLLGFFVDLESLPRQVLTGQYIGMGAIIGSSLALSLLSFVIPISWIGMIGIVPIATGSKKLMTRIRPSSSRLESEFPIELQAAAVQYWRSQSLLRRWELTTLRFMRRFWRFNLRLGGPSQSSAS